MARYKLLVGQHIQAKRDWKPSEEDLALSKQTGRPPRPPSEVFNAPAFVESDVDLVAKCGADKFQLVGSRRPRSRVDGGPTMEQSGSVAPGGQVSHGHQMATTNPDGKTVSGLDPDPPNQEEDEDDDGEDSPVETVHDREGWTREDLEQMTVEELRELATERRVNLSGATRKPDIIARLTR